MIMVTSMLIQGLVCTIYLREPAGHVRTVYRVIGGVLHIADYYDD